MRQEVASTEDELFFQLNYGADAVRLFVAVANAKITATGVAFIDDTNATTAYVPTLGKSNSGKKI